MMKVPAETIGDASFWCRQILFYRQVRYLQPWRSGLVPWHDEVQGTAPVVKRRESQQAGNIAQDLVGPGRKERQTAIVKKMKMRTKRRLAGMLNARTIQ
jgi:hypothetical protein